MSKDIGKFMQEMRKNKGLTQKELADRIGISDKTISKWENGNSVPDTSILLSLCKELGITVNELLQCEIISSDNYSMRAEETIMTLVKENEENKKNNTISRLIGGVVLLVGILFLALSTAGINYFYVQYYIDIPSLLITIFLAVGIVLVSGARKRDAVLSILGRTIVPIGLVTVIVSLVIILANITSLKSLGPNIAVASLPLLYSAIVKIVVEILLVRK